jgi:tetratricopeptide (TPR) repeat protein
MKTVFAGCLLLLSVLAARASAATLEQVQELIQKGDLAAARNGLSELLQSTPGDPNAWNLLGVVEAQQRDYRGAEQSFQRAMALAPRLGGAYQNLGHLYQDHAGEDPGARQKAVATYEQWLKFEPSNPQAHYQSAFLLLQLGSFQASLDHLARLSAPARENPQALAVSCADLAGLRRHSEAGLAADRLLQSPDLQEADVTAILPTLLGRHEDALARQLLEGLASRGQASAGARLQLAELYQSGGDLVRARATLESAVEVQGAASVELLLALAHVAYQQKDYDGALGYLAHARDLDANNAAIHFFFGMVCVEKNLAQDAYDSLKKAAALDPGNAYYNYALGAVMTSREDAREAYPYFRKYCQLKPADARGRLALGAAYFYGNDLGLARRELQGVLDHPQLAATAHYYLARIANREGNTGAAREELRECLRLRPAYADAYAELGLVEMKQKEYAAAEQALEKAIALSPASYAGNLNLMILYQRTHDARAAAQAQRFQALAQQRSERQKEFLRTIEVRP